MSAELELTALRAELKAAKRVAKQHMNRADKAEAERDTKAEACRTMGHIIELQGRWAVEATGSQDLIGDDGDGDWDVVWDRVTELGGRARDAESARRNWQSAALAMQTRAEAAEKKVAAVRGALERQVWQYPTMFHTEVDVIDVSDVLEALDGVPNE